MERIPDLTGYREEEAVEILRQLGIACHITETTSPRNDVGGHERRVARCLVKEDKTVHLTLCRY